MQILDMNEGTQIIPLGDEAILVRFAHNIVEEANIKAINFAKDISLLKHVAIKEIAASLVSVLVKYDNRKISFFELSSIIRLTLFQSKNDEEGNSIHHKIELKYDGEDLKQVSQMLSLSVEEFIIRHSEKPLRVLSTGFAPGFIYCGIHAKDLHIPRRNKIRNLVPSGAVIFAAGQSAITSTAMPTGWHVIGHCDFNNFDVSMQPPTKVNLGDYISFQRVKI